MMHTDLRTRWTRTHASQRHTKLWDNEAGQYGARPIPDRQTDGFVGYVLASGKLNTDKTVFDLGCGAGLYAFAFAPFVQSVYGLDLSSNMIEQARQRAEKLNLTNTRFDVCDWSSAIPQTLGFTQRFEIGIAHMTPAVAEFDAFEKFLSCITEHVFYETFILRNHPFMQLAFEVAGLDSQNIWSDDQLYYTLEYLLSHGFKPQLHYRPATWGSRKKTQEMIEFCTYRVHLRGEFNNEVDAAIAQAISERSINGYVECPQTATIVTVDWKM